MRVIAAFYTTGDRWGGKPWRQAQTAHRKQSARRKKGSLMEPFLLLLGAFLQETLD